MQKEYQECVQNTLNVIHISFLPLVFLAGLSEAMMHVTTRIKKQLTKAHVVLQAMPNLFDRSNPYLGRRHGEYLKSNGEKDSNGAKAGNNNGERHFRGNGLLRLAFTPEGFQEPYSKEDFLGLHSKGDFPVDYFQGEECQEEDYTLGPLVVEFTPRCLKFHKYPSSLNIHNSLNCPRNNLLRNYHKYLEYSSLNPFPYSPSPFRFNLNPSRCSLSQHQYRYSPSQHQYRCSPSQSQNQSLQQELIWLV